MNFLDKAIAAVAPTWGLRRAAAREMLVSYGGAMPTRQDTLWENSGGNPAINNAGLSFGKLKSLRDRSIALVQNNSIASGILERVVENVVGNGFGLHALSADTAWNKQAEELFAGWFDSADVLGNCWLEHLRFVVRHWQRDGDIGSIFLQNGQLQPIDPSLINTPYGKAADPTVVDGVQVDAFGRPILYWLDSWDGYTRKTKSIPVEAKDFLFLSRRKSVSAVRGEPCFANALTTFDQLDQWRDAVVKAAKIQAYFALVQTKQNPAGTLRGLPTIQGKGGDPAQRKVKAESGSLITLGIGEDIKAVSSNQPQQSFPESFILNVRTLGLEVGLPLELVLLDFSRTNYSSARAALLQAYRSFKTMQLIFIARYLARIYRWRISKWINEGKLARRDDAFKHRWIPSPWPYLDPLKEQQGIQLSLDVGTETLSGALSAVGSDFESWSLTRSREIARCKELGIPLLHSSLLQSYDAASPVPTQSVDDSGVIEEEEDLDD